MGAGVQLVLSVDDTQMIKVDAANARFGALTAGVNRGAMQMAASWGRMSRGVAAFGAKFGRVFSIVKLGLLALGVASIIVGAKFEQSMANVASVAGASAEELRELSLTARAWGERTVYSASQVADAMYSLASSGQAVRQIKDSVGGVLLYAGAAATSMSEAAETVVGSLKMFGLAATETNRVVNVLAAGISSSMLNASRLKESLAAVGATASAVGMDLEQTVGVLGLLHNAGQLGSRAGTRLKNVLTRLTSPSKAMSTLLGDLTFNGENLGPIMDSLSGKTDDLGLIFKAFGRIAAPAALVMIRAGSKGLAEMEAKVTGTTKAFDMYKIQMDTVASDFKIFKSVLQENMIASFEELKPLVRSAIGGLTEGLRRAKPYIIGTARYVREWVENNKPLIGQIVKIGAVAMVAFAIFNAVAGVVTLVGAAINIVTGAVGLLTGAFAILTSPIVLIIAIIGGLIYYMWKYRDESKSVLENVGGYFKMLWDYMIKGAKWVWTKIKAPFMTGIAWIYDKVLWLAEKLGPLLDHVFPNVSEAIIAQRALVQAAMIEFANETKAQFIGDFNIIKTKTGDVFGDMKSRVQSALTMLKSFGLDASKIDLGGMTIDDITGGKNTMTPEFVAAVKEMEGVAQSFQAKYMLQANDRFESERAWYDAKVELAQMAYDQEYLAASDNAAKIAEAQINYDNTVLEAMMAHEDAKWERYQQTHIYRMLMLDSLTAAYDTFFATITDMEMSGQARREAMWDSMKRTFVRNAAEMFKQYLIMQLKNLALGFAAEKSYNMKVRYLEAKIGAMKAYQAFAGIPIIGPVLGAAAAAAAFAFLMAFHTGGLIGSQNAGRDVPILAQEGEYMIQRRAVQTIGVSTLDQMNATGRAPSTGGDVHYHNEWNVGGGSSNDEDGLREQIEDQVLPILADLAREGIFST